MRILHSCQSVSRSFGGVFEAVRHLVAEQSELESRPQIRVVGAADEFTEPDRGEWAGCEVKSYPVVGPRAMGWSSRLASLYREFSPDVVHVHGLWMYYSLLNQRYCRRHRVPYVISPHGMLDAWALRNSSWKKSLARILFEDRHLRYAACLHALCTEEADALRRLGFRNPICVIPNGVSLPQPDWEYRPPAPWAGQIPGDSRVMLFLGRLHPKKGLDNLIEAWSLLRENLNPKDCQQWRLVIAGWGVPTYVDQLQAKVRQLRLEQEVCFAGPLFGEPKAAAFRNAAAFILPSQSEGLPVAVLEAWSYQLPVLMTAACNLGIGFQRGAAICVGESAEEIARPLQSFIRMPDSELMRIGMRGSQLAAEEFTWRHVASSFAHVYKCLTSGAPIPAELHHP